MGLLNAWWLWTIIAIIAAILTTFVIPAFGCVNPETGNQSYHTLYEFLFQLKGECPA
jgi:hypothetical protein